MITHYIIMSSSYSKGKRIALDYIVSEKSKYLELKEILTAITDKCGKDVSISTHFIQTDSALWDSVVQKDYFFRDVELIEDINVFIELIKKDRVLTGLDVAKYILCKVKCTHLKLEKLTYLAFAEYLCKYNKELYQDSIYAYKYGPVVETVYRKYKRYGYKEIEYDDEDIDTDGLYEMPSRSRILFAEDGVNKAKSIDDTLEIYGVLSAERLVGLTHKQKTPWDVSGRGMCMDEIIKNDTIKEYHCNEII